MKKVQELLLSSQDGLRRKAQNIQRGFAGSPKAMQALLEKEQGKALKDALAVLDEVVDVRKRARDRFALIRLYEDLARAAQGVGDPARAAAAAMRPRTVSIRSASSDVTRSGSLPAGRRCGRRWRGLWSSR